jgi:putative DNA methylase
MTYPKRLIEVDLPIKRISAHSRREKSIRHGHISTLHIWWARRPLAACRAVICAALWPDPADENCPQAFRDAAARLITEFAEKVYNTTSLHATSSKESFGQWDGVVAAKAKGIEFDTHDPAHLNKLRFALLDFIADFANWDNSTVREYLDTSGALTQAAHEALGGAPGTRPLVVDPFAGGGSIPLEALRVGADAFASDLNPVAVLLNKVVLEYIPKYGQRLADEVRKCGEWIKHEAEKELGRFYPVEADGHKPVGYLWARTILSEAPAEGELPVELPVFRSMWLSSKPKRRFAFRWLKDNKGRVRTEMVQAFYADGTVRKVRRPLMEVFQPDSPLEVEKGTSAGGAATCPVTGFTTSVERVREQLKLRAGGGADARLLCVITTPKKNRGEYIGIQRRPT